MALIEVNDTCNAGCTFCGIRRVGLRPSGQVKADLGSLHPGSDTVMFGGGEPTLDPRLASWISQARDLGIDGRGLETNALRASDAAYVAELVEAGLEEARVMLLSTQVEAWKAVTRRSDGMDMAWAGLGNLLGAGVQVDVVVPIARANGAEVVRIMARLAADAPGIRSIQLRPVFFDFPTGEGEGDARRRLEVLELARANVLPLADQAQVLMDAVALGTSLGIEVGLDLRGGVPLCSLRRSPAAMASVRGRPRSPLFRPDCADCAMKGDCPGVNAVADLAHGETRVRPFDRVPPQLTRNGNPEPVLIFSKGLPSHRYGEGEKAEIRVVMPCNQNCTFCFVNREAPNATRGALEQAVDQALSRRVQAIVFTGGEPTLSRELAPLVERARAGGVPCRGIQTNGLLLASGDLAADLVNAGLNHAHISFHSVDVEAYLAITGFGSPDQALAGARALSDRGVELSISLVICRANAGTLDATIGALFEHLPEARVVLAVAREQYGLDRPWDTTLMRYDEAAQALGVALRAATRVGLAVDVAASCALPPCMLGTDDLARFGHLFLMGRREAFWHEAEGEGHRVANNLAPSCADCALRRRCPGITRSYLERHGTEEFHPIGLEAAGRLGLV